MKPSSYRWVVLSAFMFITVTVEIQWLTHAAVERPAEVFYRGQFNAASFINIDFLAMLYMILFLVLSFPASYLINRYGIRRSLRAGALIASISALAKAVFSGNFAAVVIAQAGLATAQPFILNAVTAVTVRWFPLNERGLAAGLSALAQYIGIIIAMLVTPLLVASDPELANYGSGFDRMLWIYGLLTAVSALTVFLVIREHPEGYVLSGDDSRQPFGKGIIHILGNRDMRITLLLFMIGLGIFNAISSMTDSITEYAGVKDSDGLIGGLMLVGGIFGALILPVLSDRLRRRKIFLVICLGGMVPGITGMAFIGSLGLAPESTYSLLLASSFILGFFVMSAGPIGFQYAAEVSYPAPESASQGMLLWFGQLSGMVFVALMSMNNNEMLGFFLLLFAVLTILSFLAGLSLRESPMIRDQTSV